MERPTCGTCPYWDYDEQKNKGFCHRHAPIPMPQKMTKLGGWYETNAWEVSETISWREVASTDWCGEHPHFEVFAAWFEPPKTSGSSPAIG